MCTQRFETENHSCTSVIGKKGNCCIILPTNAVLVAESIDKRNGTRYVRTEVACNFIVQIDETSFHLHKLPMVSRSGYMNRLVFQRISNKETSPYARVDNFPGGYKIFELVVRFCYGMTVKLTASNVAPLYCAANFLEMSDDLEQGNLISKTEPFLSFIIFSSWKDTIWVLTSCETISSWARDLGILKRCSESIAWKASINSNVTGCDDNDILECSDYLENGYDSIIETLHESWWFKDLLVLRVDHFAEVITSCKSKGIRSELVGSCIAHWTAKWLSKISLDEFEHLSDQKHLTARLYKVTITSLIMLLPEDEKSVSCNFLLHLLKLGLMMKVDCLLLSDLERRVTFMLMSCHAKELLVKNYGHGKTLYDVEIVGRVLAAYVSLHSDKSSVRIYVIGRLVDEFLALVARDYNLPPNIFQLIVEALPRSYRLCDNNLYRAIDMYLKAHPSLTERERTEICQAMDYQKLSQEARDHALRNDRLPTNIITRFILLEQVLVTRSITTTGSNYRRTKSQMIIRATKSLGKGWMNFQKEVKMMNQEVNAMKAQLCQLQTCIVALQRQAKSFTKVW